MIALNSILSTGEDAVTQWDAISAFASQCSPKDVGDHESAFDWTGELFPTQVVPCKNFHASRPPGYELDRQDCRIRRYAPPDLSLWTKKLVVVESRG